MMMKTNRWMGWLTMTTLALAGCYTSGPTDDTASIGEALELENGGLDMEDELPTFGDIRFDQFELGDVQPLLEDPMESAIEVALMAEAPDAVVVHAQIHWGQLRWNPDLRTPRNWTGFFAVNRGAIIARRTVLFEGPTDNLLPRRDPRYLPFTSATLPHHDGLVVTIIDPTPEAGEPLTLTYVNDLPGPAGPEGGHLFTIPVASLLDGPRELLSDELGNRMIAAATAEAVDLCEGGFIGGRWHRVADGRGIFLGQVRGRFGGLRGHIRGIYGVRRNGDRVFFGKYIGVGGHFRGILVGTYADGHFEGRWLDRSGERGVLGGEYRERIPGPEVGGHFLGAWRETSCHR